MKPIDCRDTKTKEEMVGDEEMRQVVSGFLGKARHVERAQHGSLSPVLVPTSLIAALCNSR